MGAGPPGLELRDAERADAADLATLMTQLGYPTDPQAMRDRLEGIARRPDFATLVAVRGGRVVGMAGLQVCPTYTRDEIVGRLVAMVVEEEARGMGVGGLLLSEAERRLTRLGASRVVVLSATRREGAHRFYQRHGYETTGLRFVKALTPPATPPEGPRCPGPSPSRRS